MPDKKETFRYQSSLSNKPGASEDSGNSRPALAAVIFDMDGLMFDSERIVQMSWNITGDRLGYKRLGDNIYHTLGMNAARRKIYFQSIYGPDFPYEAFHQYTRSVFQEIVRENGIPMKPGLTELLDFLKSSGIRAAVATSSSQDYAMRNLKNAGIDSCFSGFLTGNMVTQGKPAPEIYEKACRLIGVSPWEALALEDSPNGIRSAHAAGLRPIMIPDLVKEAPEIDPLLEARLASLHDVIPYIQEHFSF